MDYATVIIKKPKEIHNYYNFSIPVGQYIDFDVKPTCGLASTEKLIGMYDEPRYFADPEHIHASILWFTTGYVKYSIPNYLLASQEPDMLEIMLELGSEAPGSLIEWPSDITFYVNDINIGTFTSPGDFNDKKGFYTPEWWPENISQYGLLKRILVEDNGTFIDGRKVSNVNISDLNIKENRYITFTITVHEDSLHPGGVTIFGKGFGNYDTNIEVKLYYKQINK
ncbi:transcriptional regulator [Caldicellulosiruptoraceae bacterium PP1]